MTDRLEQALDRLREIASKAESEGRGMEISEIVEAVVGLDSDEELEDLAGMSEGDLRDELIMYERQPQQGEALRSLQLRVLLALLLRGLERHQALAPRVRMHWALAPLRRIHRALAAALVFGVCVLVASRRAAVQVRGTWDAVPADRLLARAVARALHLSWRDALLVRGERRHPLLAGAQHRLSLIEQNLRCEPLRHLTL